MFGFERLEVYNLAHRQYKKQTELLQTIHNKNLPEDLVAAFSAASLVIIQQFARGSSKMENEDKKKHYEDARTAVFESVALLKVINEISPKLIAEEDFTELYNNYESLSRMMLSLIRNMSNGSKGAADNGKRKRNHNAEGDFLGEHKSSSHSEIGSGSSFDDDDSFDFNKLNIGE